MTQHRDLADELMRRSGFKQSPRISFGSDGSLDDPESIKARIFQLQAKKFKAEYARARAERDDEIAFLKSKLKEAGHAMDADKTMTREREGWKAFKAGKKESDNPYTKGSMGFSDWELGFRTAKNGRGIPNE